MEEKLIWALAEITHDKLNPVSFETIARAVALKPKVPGGKVVSIVIGKPIADEEIQKLIAQGADEVNYIKDERLEAFHVQNYSNALQALVEEKKPFIFLASATTYGRTILPYLTIRIKAGLTADCTELDIEDETYNLLQTRPAIGGNILATIKTPDHRPQMATLRPHSTKVLEADSSRSGEVVVVTPKDEYFTATAEFLGHEVQSEEDVALGDAVKIVSLGRGVQSPDNIGAVKEVAEYVGALVGASRSAVDEGWMTYPHQVGLTGKTVSPDLYMAMGISGAIQHLAGMQTSKHIIAVNKDSEAQIFRVANLGIVGDVLAVLPVLAKKLKARRGE